jgi:hypothetical protein
MKEMQEILIQKERGQEDIKEWMATVGNNVAMINSLEQKVRQITSEKRDYELLLTRYYS